MKNYHFPLLALLWLLSSGAAYSESSENRIIVAGKLTNPEQAVIKAVLGDDLAESNLAEDGSFHLVIHHDEPENFVLVNGNLRFGLYLSPGDSIYVTGDSKEFATTFTASGDKAKENTYLRFKNKAMNESGLQNWPVLMQLPAEEYFQKKDSLMVVVKAPLEDLKKEQDIDTRFLKLEEAYYSYESLYMDMMFPMVQSSVAKIPLDSVDFPSEGVNKQIENLPISDPDLLKVNPYRYVLDRQLMLAASELIKEDSTLAYPDAKAIILDKMIENQQIKDQLMFDELAQNIQYRGPVHSASAIETFKAKNQTDKFNKELEKLIAKWEPISPGVQVPDFSFSDIEGNEVKLSDLKGSLVYIDIWATWCGPCIAEHPHWDKLKDDYKEKDVAFLTVSIDNTRDPWEKMVKNKKMEGLQWFAENAWQSELTTFFMVNAIPRFILLDSEGKIIDPSADRPSGSIRETLDKYLEG